MSDQSTVDPPAPVAESVRCRELRLRDFRNFDSLEVSFPDAGAVIIGDNGAGKTNLLEGLFYLEIFRSFRGAPDEQLVRFGAEAFHVRGRFEGADEGRTLELAAAFDRRGRRKRVTVDGAEPERLGDALGTVGAVIFSPSDVALVSGPPGVRRRFLDIVLSLSDGRYLEALQRYRNVLRQRNQMLRDGSEPALLEAWDGGLVEAGARVIAARASWLAGRARGFDRYFRAIGGGGAGRLEYAPAVPFEAGSIDVPLAEAGAASRSEERLELETLIGEAFREELARVRRRELERGMTLAGPHRDDFGCFAERGEESVDLREYGSGGQQRTAAVALRLIEADTIRLARGREPLVLLDDIFAELDPGRSERLVDLLETGGGMGQVIITAPKPGDVAMLRGGALERRRIADGVLQ